MRKKTKGASVSTKITAMVLIMVVLSSVSIGVFSYIVYRNDSIRYQGQRAMAAAAAMASVIDVAQFQHIAATEEQTEYYLQMKEFFTETNRNVGTLYLYAMIKDDDGIHYKYVFAAETDLDNPMLGGKDTIKSYGEFALRAFDTGEQVISDIYDNEGYGLLVSAFYPLFDENGATVGLVCADIQADGVMASIRDYRDKVLLAVVWFVLLFGVISVAYSLRLFSQAKLAEQRVRKLAAIMAIADAGIIVKDQNGAVLEWNKGAEKIFGYKPEEVLGKTPHSYSPEEDHEVIDLMEARLRKGEHIPNVEIARRHTDGRLIDCTASFTPIFDNKGVFDGSVDIFQDVTEKKKTELSLQKAHETILSGIEYASKIQRNLLPSPALFEEVFADYAAIWRPKDIVGGDIYWLKRFECGSVLCVCDCTGHGTPGALLTVFVVSALESIVNEGNCWDTANVIWELDRRLVNVLNSGASSLDILDGCDLAVLFIGRDGMVRLSSGNMRVFVCDGKEVKQLKGQKLFVGEGTLESKADVDKITISSNHDQKFYIASDGLFDQMGGEKDLPFGYSGVMELILAHHNENQAVIAEKIWEAFEAYRGDTVRVDDFELIAFRTKEDKVWDALESSKGETLHVDDFELISFKNREEKKG